MVDYTKVPVPYMASGLQLWVEAGISPGSFMKALLANDLYTAVTRADDLNMRMITKWVIFIHNNLPAGCYGSYEQLKEWQNNFEEKKQDGSQLRRRYVL